MRRGRHRGVSLIEIMIALAIVGLMVGGATLGLRSLLKSELRGAAGQLAGAIRYSYDRAVTTGSYYRLHFNLDDQTYKLEKAEGRMFLAREKERSTRGRGLDLAEEAAREAEEEQRRNGTQQGLPDELLPPPSPRRARFEDFKDTTLKPVTLKRIKVLDLYTARQTDPYFTGHAYLHFFPDGHTERAVLHLGTDLRDDDQYTLVVHGLTGRVEIRPGRYLPPGDFETVDDAGNKKVDR